MISQNEREDSMASIKYRSGSSFVKIFDSADISSLKSKVSALPRLPLNGAVGSSGGWPYGIIYWNVSEDKKLFHIHGNIYFDSSTDAWNKMKNIPGRPSDEWALKVEMPLGAQAEAKRLSGCGFTTTTNPLTPTNMHRDELIVGTDGNVYLWPTTSNPGGDGAFNLWVSAWYVNVDDLPAA